MFYIASLLKVNTNFIFGLSTEIVPVKSLPEPCENVAVTKMPRDPHVTIINAELCSIHSPIEH